MILVTFVLKTKNSKKSLYQIFFIFDIRFYFEKN